MQTLLEYDVYCPSKSHEKVDISLKLMDRISFLILDKLLYVWFVDMLYLYMFVSLRV